MAKLLKLRRGSTSAHASFTGAEGEVTIDTTKDTAVVHDGSQAGGRPLAREDMSNVSSASIAGQLGTDSIAVGKIAAGTLPSDVKITDSNIAGNLTIATGDINNDAVTFGKIQNISAGRMLGNTTGGSGDMAEMTAANVRSFINVENGATADQSAAEIRTLVESASDSNVFTDADHSKLNGIESGATGDQTAAEILTAIKTVDGSGSGLDADTLDGMNASSGTGGNTIVQRNASGYVFANYFNTSPNDVSSGITKVCVETSNDGYIRHGTAAGVRTFLNVENGATADQTKSDIDGLNINADQVDGLHGSQFIRSDTADTASGDITFTGGAGAVSVGSASDIRIAGGTWTGEYSSGIKIQPDPTNSYFQYQGVLYFRRGSDGSNRLNVDSTGNLTASGNVTAYSDARLKTNVNTINDALSIVGKLRGVSFDWKENGKRSIGVIAQEVEEVLPELVLTNQDVNPVTQEIEEIKSVDYGKIVGVLINAINELKAEVDELKGGK